MRQGEDAEWLSVLTTSVSRPSEVRGAQRDIDRRGRFLLPKPRPGHEVFEVTLTRCHRVMICCYRWRPQLRDLSPRQGFRRLAHRGVGRVTRRQPNRRCWAPPSPCSANAGFEGATIREIGECAGVDAALIARYFGSKADLYIVAVAAEGEGDYPPREYEWLPDMAAVIVTRTDRRGLGPVTQALIRSDTPEEIRRSARTHLARRLVAPMEAEMRRRGADRPRIRAEITVAALLGVNLGRALGWFADLHSASRDELVELVTSILDDGSGGDHRGSKPEQ